MNLNTLPCPQKRQFIPSFDSILGNGKRFRNTHSSYSSQPWLPDKKGPESQFVDVVRDEFFQRPPLRAKRFANELHQSTAMPLNKHFLQPQSFSRAVKAQPFNFLIADQPKPRLKPRLKVLPTSLPETKQAESRRPPVPLHSSQRAEQRAQFDEQRRERDRRAALAQEAQAAAEADREKAEISEMRKQMQFRARPLHWRDPFVPLLPQRPLTIPQGPVLLTGERCELRGAMKRLHNLSLESDSSTTATVRF